MLLYSITRIFESKRFNAVPTALDCALSRHADDSCLSWNHAEAPGTTAEAQIIDGKLTSELIRKELALEAAAVKSKYGKAWSLHLPLPAAALLVFCTAADVKHVSTLCDVW